MAVGGLAKLSAAPFIVDATQLGTQPLQCSVSRHVKAPEAVGKIHPAANLKVDSLCAEQHWSLWLQIADTAAKKCGLRHHIWL